MGVLIVFVCSSTVLKTAVSALCNQPRALGEMSHAGFNSMVNMALLCSLYGTYWDPHRKLAAINYFPGLAYVWLVAWLPLWILFLGLAQTCTAARAASASYTGWRCSSASAPSSTGSSFCSSRC